MAKSKVFASSLVTFLTGILVFAMSPPAASAKPKFKVLATIPGGLWSGLTLDAKGNLYGVTSGGGENGIGSVFEVDTLTGTASGRSPRLHSFDGT